MMKIIFHCYFNIKTSKHYAYVALCINFLYKKTATYFYYVKDARNFNYFLPMKSLGWFSIFMQKHLYAT